MECVRAPVLLNCWKHHAGFALAQIDYFQHQGPEQLPALVEALRVVGSAQMDWYYGPASPAQIGTAILRWLTAHGYQDPAAYAAWLHAHGGYHTVTLDSFSTWVVRWGEQDGYHVHLHPARYAPHTLRLRAPLLKVAIGVMVWAGIYGGDVLDLVLINHVRQTLFALAPIPQLHQHQGLAPVLRMFQQLSAASVEGMMAHQTPHPL